MPNDFEYMQRALELALNGRGFTAPNPLVGAVIVKNGCIAGEGWHRAHGGPHAETEAITAAQGNTEGADMYVTLEPCAHYGKTPPCVNAIIEAGIKRVVVALQDPHSLAAGGAEILRRAGVAVEMGLCCEQAAFQNRFFLHFTRYATPYVIAKCAMTLDGYIAAPSGDSKWITNETARLKAHELRHEVSAILVGAGTIKQDNPRLTARFTANNADPARIVLAPYADLDPLANVFTVESKAKSYIAVYQDTAENRLEPYYKANIPVIKISRTASGAMDLNELLVKLGEKGLNSLLVEGGSRTLGSFFQTNLVNECRFFIAPKVLGGQGLSPTTGVAPALIRDAKRFYNTKAELLDGDVLISVFDKPEA